MTAIDVAMRRTRAVQGLVDRLEEAVAPEPFDDDTWWHWQPIAVEDFLAGMQVLRDFLGPRSFTHSFLDVGSGIGSKLFLADALGFEAEGIERYKPYVELSRVLFPTFPVQLVDAESFTGYADYHVVYISDLAKDPDRQLQVERHVTTHMLSGTLLFAQVNNPPDWLEPIGPQVWRV